MPYDRYAIQPPSHYSVLGDNPEKQNKTKKQDHNQHEKTEEQMCTCISQEPWTAMYFMLL